jgi:hypothetical protein
MAATEATIWVTKEKLMSMAASGVLLNKPRTPEPMPGESVSDVVHRRPHWAALEADTRAEGLIVAAERRAALRGGQGDAAVEGFTHSKGCTAYQRHGS